MRAPIHRRQVTMSILLLACAAVVIGHAVTGHAHADLLAAVPLEHHVPGDSHHQLTGASCESLRTSVAVDAVPPAGAASIQPEIARGRLPNARGATGAAPAQGPPIFLLHAALLI